MCEIAIAKYNELAYEFLPQQPYSPEIALTDVLLFPNLNKCLVGKGCVFLNEIFALIDP